MPTYVYKNLVTGETFEVQQRITEDALTEHPETGEPVKRLIQPVGIAFKGSGFYVNDSRSSAAGRKSSGSSDSGSDSSGSSGSSDSGSSDSGSSDSAGSGTTGSKTTASSTTA
mgnify:CR=1 FL=1